ncbi:MAG: Maf family protein [Alphaproteobacteria bacterium]
MTQLSDLILASASPRRLDLLSQIGIEPADVVPADIDEAAARGELPRDHARRLADEKADTVAGRHPGRAVLAADTVVAVGRRILPKAETEKEALACLKLLSGRRHVVYGGIVLIGADGVRRNRIVETAVIFKRLHPDEVAAYLESGEWHGKAGGYAIQGRAAAFIRRINGSYSNVVGLDLFATAQLLGASRS